MAIVQPSPTDTLLVDNHALMHQVYAIDSAAPPQSIFVDSSGRIGIGTVTPSSLLTVNGTATITTLLATTITTTSLMATTVTAGAGGITLGGVNNTSWPNNTQWTTSGSNIYYNIGNIGIGTTSPNFLFQTHVATNQNFMINDVGGYTQIGAINDAGNTYATLKIDASTLLLNVSSGGNVGIGTSSPAGVLDVTSTTSAFLPPRMTTTQKNAIVSPIAGMVVYDTILGGLSLYTSSWGQISSNLSQIGKPILRAIGDGLISVSNNVSTLIPYSAEIDTTSAWISSSTHKYTPQVAGYYRVTNYVEFQQGSGVPYKINSIIYFNGTSYSESANVYSSNFDQCGVLNSDIVYMNGSTDYIQFYCAVTSSGAGVLYLSGSSYATVSLI